MKINIYDDQKAERPTVVVKSETKIKEDSKVTVAPDTQKKSVYESAPGDEINQTVG